MILTRKSRQILIPLPDHGFDVTEVAVPWKLLTEAGYVVCFATENGKVARCDERLLAENIGGKILGAASEPREFYRQMRLSDAFCHPIQWANIVIDDYAGLLLPGGHAPGMRQYLGSKRLQTLVAKFWTLNRPIGAICHGVILAARSKDEQTGKSVIAEKKTTCLPKYMEKIAYFTTFWWLGRHYRTYPIYVEDEVRDALDNPREQFIRGPMTLMKRGTRRENAPAFIVQDRNYVSARWPGDAYLFTETFINMLNQIAL